MPVLCLLSLISRNSPKQLGMVYPELRRNSGSLGLTADVGGKPAIIIAIVPLDEVRGDLGDGREACKLASPPRPLERADQDLGERYPLEPCSQPPRVALAPLGQGDIGPSRVPADSDHAVSPWRAR